MFIIDYHSRCEKKLKDDLSKDFRKIYKKTTNIRVDFKEHILDTWSKHNPGNPLLNELNSLFLYRHWIAHGRYWLPKINTLKYDFNYLYLIALQIKTNFNLYE
jgi:mRNA-degrading endonuclease RelE of RelBE toxin-antitoxin system